MTRSVSILMYHQVAPFPQRPAAHRPQYCDVARFRAQMRFLAWARFGVIGLAEAWRGLAEGGPLPSRPVVLTFDDGYDNFERHAWPILREHGFACSVFAVSGQLGGAPRWLDPRRGEPPLMDGASLRRLRREGVDIGSHTVSHPRLSQLSAERQAAELRDSKSALEDLLGEAVPHLCYPYGDYDRRARDAAAAAGYRLALTCVRAAATPLDDALQLPRKGISWGDNLVGYAWKLLARKARKGQGMRPTEYD